MTKDQVISIHRKSTFSILDGEFAGKSLQISQIDFDNEVVTTKSGKRFLFSSIKPVLKHIKDITFEEAKEIYRLYWNSGKTYDGPLPIANFIENSNNVIYDVIRLWEGRDYVAGDRLEWANVITFCIDKSIDIFNLLQKDQAIKL